MGKKILILNGSPRKTGNTAALTAEFAKGVEEAGILTRMPIFYMNYFYSISCYYFKTPIASSLFKYLHAVTGDLPVNSSAFCVVISSLVSKYSIIGNNFFYSFTFKSFFKTSFKLLSFFY